MLAKASFTGGLGGLTLAGFAYRELPPVRDPAAYTDVSRELSCELCSFALPVSTMCFMETPPQGRPDSCLFGYGSNSPESGGLYAPAASCWFVVSLSLDSRSSLAFCPALPHQSSLSAVLRAFPLTVSSLSQLVLDLTPLSWILDVSPIVTGRVPRLPSRARSFPTCLLFLRHHAVARGVAM